MQAIEKTSEYITDNMIPSCDYTPIFMLENENGDEEYERWQTNKVSAKNSFRRAVRRVIQMINRKNETVN